MSEKDDARDQPGRQITSAHGLVRKPLVLPAGSGAVVLAVRVAASYVWFWGASGKAPWNGFGWFSGYVERQARYAQIGAYKWFLESVVIPNILFFSWLQFVVETILFLCLALGAFTRAAAAFAVVWAANIVLGSYPVPVADEVPTQFEPPYVHVLLIAVPLVVWGLCAGRAFGVDAWLRPRWKESPNRVLRWLARWTM